jgi:glycosyltransferase involved in cell wall biosynthesis
MRVLVASYYYPPHVGGVERQAQILTSGLAARGHVVRVVSARIDPSYPTHERVGGVEIERVSPGPGGRWRTMGTYLAGLLAAAARLRRQTDAVLVFQALYPAAAMSLYCRAARLPLVVSNTGSGRFGAVQLMRRLPLGPQALSIIASYGAAVCVSDEMRSEMESARFRRIERIYNSVEDRPRPAREERDELRRRLGFEGTTLLYVGRFEEEKGVDVLVEAWRRARPSGRLVLVGDGTMRASLEARVAADPYARTTIRFEGIQRDPWPHLCAADAFVLPSRSEGLSVALLEAMCAALPILATAVGGNREVIQNGVHGILCPPEDPDALANALNELLVRKDGWSALGSAARARQQQGFSAASMVASYERLLEDMIAQGC